MNYLCLLDSNVPLPAFFCHGFHQNIMHHQSSQCWIYRITKLRTDGIRCRHMASNPQGSYRELSFHVNPWNQLLCALFFPNPLQTGTTVGMSITEKGGRSLKMMEYCTLVDRHDARNAKINLKKKIKHQPQVIRHFVGIYWYNTCDIIVAWKTDYLCRSTSTQEWLNSSQ